MKKIFCLLLVLLLTVTCAGCRTNHTLQTDPSGSQDPTSGSLGAENQTPEKTEPTTDTKPTVGTEPTVTPTQPQDRYESGKPYAPWGAPMTFTFRKKDGNTVSVTAQVPAFWKTNELHDTAWSGRTEDQSTDLMIGLVESGTYEITELKSFFKIAFDKVLSDCKSYYAYAGNDTALKFMSPQLVEYEQTAHCMAIGSIRYKGVEYLSIGLVGYAVQLDSGDYLYWLAICRDYSDWPLVRETAENFARTLREVSP